MTKKKKSPKASGDQSAKRAAAQRLALQRGWMKLLRDEVEYLHDDSLELMVEKGILPPLYGGEHLEDGAEVLPLWGETADGKTELGLVLLRAMPNTEPNPGLVAARADIDMQNDWPITQVFAEIFEALGTSEDTPQKPPFMDDEHDDLMIALTLSGDQLFAAPGYEQAAMLEHMGEERPYALFLHIPVIGEGDDWSYNWDDLEHFRAEVVFEETPEFLEGAVWRYRLDLALLQERIEILAENLDPLEEQVAENAAELAANFDLMVLDVMRYYGVTSPVRAKQEALDVLRGDADDLIVRLPLKSEIEPVKLLAEVRKDLKLVGGGDQLFSISIDNEMSQVWPQLRSHPYFCVRSRWASIVLGRKGQPTLNGFLPKMVLEWMPADSLPELYRHATLLSLRQMLILTGQMPNPSPPAENEPSDLPEWDDTDEDAPFTFIIPKPPSKTEDASAE